MLLLWQSHASAAWQQQYFPTICTPHVHWARAHSTQPHQSHMRLQAVPAAVRFSLPCCGRCDRAGAGLAFNLQQLAPWLTKHLQPRGRLCRASSLLMADGFMLERLACNKRLSWSYTRVGAPTAVLAHPKLPRLPLHTPTSGVSHLSPVQGTLHLLHSSDNGRWVRLSAQCVMQCKACRTVLYKAHRAICTTRHSSPPPPPCPHQLF